MKFDYAALIVVGVVTILALLTLVYSIGAGKQLYMQKVLHIEASWIQALNYNIPYHENHLKKTSPTHP
jgi:hypothetical protein